MRTKRITRIEQVNAFPLCWPEGKARMNALNEAIEEARRIHIP